MRGKKVVLGIILALLLSTCGGVRPDLNVVTDFKMLKTPHGIVMVVKGTRRPTYTIFRLTDPLRIVVDVAYTDVSKFKKAYRVKDSVIRAVKVYQYGNNAANVARFEIYLKEMKEYVPRVEGDSLLLIFPSGNLGQTAASEGNFVNIAQNEGENILEEDEGLFEEPAPAEETATTENEEVTAPTTTTKPTEKTQPKKVQQAKTEKKSPSPATTVTKKQEQIQEENITEEKPVTSTPTGTTTVTQKVTQEKTNENQQVTTQTAPGTTEEETLFGEEETAPAPTPQTSATTLAPAPTSAPAKVKKTAPKPVAQQEGVPELEEQQKLEEKALGPATATTTEEMEETSPTPPPPPPEEQQQKPKVADKVLDINVERQEKSTLIRIVGNGPIGNYNVFKLNNPARLVVDLWNVGNLFPTNQLFIDTPTIKELRLGQHPEKLRVVIEFKTKEVPDYTVNKVDDSLQLVISEIPPAVVKTPEEMRQELEARALGQPTTSSVVAQTAPPPPPPPPATQKPSTPAPAVSKAPQQQQTTPPEEVMPETVPQVSPPPAVQQTVPGVRKKVAKPQKPKPIIPSTVHRIEVQKPVTVAPLTPQEELAKVRFKAPKKIYRGRRISLDFKDADIHNVLRLLAEVSNLNIIASSDVKGKVTVRMVNVPWDQALDVILQTLGLGYVKIGNVIRVAPRKELEQEEKERLESIKNRRELEPLYVKIIPVNYGKATEIAKQVKPLLSKRGSISVDKRTNVIIVKDIMRNIKEVETLVHNLDTQTPQVLIAARIVEATTNFAQELGIQWGGKIAFGSAYGTPTGLNFPANGVMAGYNPTAEGGGGNATSNVGNLQSGYVVDLPAAIAAGAATSLGLVLGSINNSTVLDLRLSAIEDSGEGRIISSPRITTLDNREAIIEQGYSIPYETVSQQGTQTQFIDATLKLKVTPHITADRNIILDLDITKNAPETGITSRFGIPSISKKEAKTQILLKDGETAVIGGIFQIDKSKSNTGVPFLSKIPIIGWLFRRSRSEDKRTELLIFITPRIIERSVGDNK